MPPTPSTSSAVLSTRAYPAASIGTRSARGPCWSIPTLTSHEPFLPDPHHLSRKLCADLHRSERGRRRCDVPRLDHLDVPVAADPVHALDRVPPRLVPAYLLRRPRRESRVGRRKPHVSQALR